MPETTQFGELPENGNGGDGALKPNTILLARYKIDAVLGSGGQGAVYRARDLNFPEAKRLVAVKEMLITAGNPNMRASTMKTFQREANILATLAHPAIPKIYDFFDQNERAYLVMEYINGNDMEALITKLKKIPMEKIIDWAIELCDVLYYLHSYQPEPIIFRDMKPANVMIDGLGKVRLIDFGIARVFDPSKGNTTVGTEGYSAPEQYRGQANPSSDIYSLGATLHHLITRQDPRLQPPFSFAERPMSDFNPETTPELITIIDRALQFEAKDRFANCAEMKTAFEAIRYGRGASVIAAPVSAPMQGTQGGSKPVVANPESNKMSPQPSTDTGFIEGGTNTLGSAIQPKWRFKTEDEVRASAMTFNNIVYIGSYDSNMWAIKIDDGSYVWKRATDVGVVTTPVLSEDRKLVLFGSEDCNFYAADQKDGRVMWTYLTGDKIRSSPRVALGYVFFGSDDGKLYALMQPNGRYMWEYDASAAIRSTPFVTSERIIFGTEAGEVVGLELSGSRKWSYRTKQRITSSPFVDMENICYVAGFDKHIYALDADNGLSMWRFRTNGEIVSSPVVDRNMVFFGSTDGRLYCVNTQTGKEKWTFDTTKPIVASPIVHEGIVYFGGTDKFFYAVDAKNGKQIWRFEANGMITGAPLIANNLIIFGALDHYVYALPLVGA